MKFYDSNNDLMYDEYTGLLYNDAARTKFSRVLRDLGLDGAKSFFTYGDDLVSHFSRCEITNEYSDCITVFFHLDEKSEPIEYEVSRDLAFCLFDSSYTHEIDFTMPA